MFKPSHTFERILHNVVVSPISSTIVVLDLIFFWSFRTNSVFCVPGSEESWKFSISKGSSLRCLVIYLPLFGDAGDRLITEFSLRPERGCESTNNRGSDRKTRKCQNSISKQTVNIVTLFMLNKNDQSWFQTRRANTCIFFAQEIQKLVDESGGASSWRSNPFVHHQKIWFVDFWGI